MALLTPTRSALPWVFLMASCGARTLSDDPRGSFMPESGLDDAGTRPLVAIPSSTLGTARATGSLAATSVGPGSVEPTLPQATSASEPAASTAVPAPSAAASGSGAIPSMPTAMVTVNPPWDVPVDNPPEGLSNCVAQHHPVTSGCSLEMNCNLQDPSKYVGLLSRCVIDTDGSWNCNCLNSQGGSGKNYR
jgi:hypothetical protein